jgi:hypothetical protein
MGIGILWSSNGFSFLTVLGCAPSERNGSVFRTYFDALFGSVYKQLGTSNSAKPFDVLISLALVIKQAPSDFLVALKKLLTNAKHFFRCLGSTARIDSDRNRNHAFHESFCSVHWWSWLYQTDKWPFRKCIIASDCRAIQYQIINLLLAGC